MKINLNFLGGGGVQNKIKTFRGGGGGMDIFWNCTIAVKKGYHYFSRFFCHVSECTYVLSAVLTGYVYEGIICMLGFHKLLKSLATLTGGGALRRFSYK